MAGWFSSNSAFDEQVEKATSSSLDNIELNLEVADVVRSKSVPAKDAMRSLKKRINNKNGNIQIASLRLTDICVKNSGSHFLTEIASREFMDNLVSLLKAYGPAAVNEDVKAVILELIQVWAGITEGRHDLSYIGETYQTLQKEGYTFPPRIELAKTMVDSSAPPEWTDSDVCMRCRNQFTFTNRKHHCRNCGNTFCGSCSSKLLPLPHLGIQQPVRVDDGCYMRLTDKRTPGAGAPPSDHSRSTSKSLPQGQPQSKSVRVLDPFEEDLQQALKNSMADSAGGQPAAASSNAPGTQKDDSSKQASQQTAEDFDAELEAAIAASIRDMEEQKQSHAESMKKESAKRERTGETAKFVLPKSDYELTAVEAENINLFATLVDRLQNQPPGTILREPQIQELYESIGALRPKLARTYGETMSKHDTLRDLYSKLSTVVRYYDRMLEDRLSSTYSQHNLGGYDGSRSAGAYDNSNPASYYTNPQAPEPQAQPGYGAPYGSHQQQQYPAYPQTAGPPPGPADQSYYGGYGHAPPTPHIQSQPLEQPQISHQSAGSQPSAAPQHASQPPPQTHAFNPSDPLLASPRQSYAQLPSQQSISSAPPPTDPSGAYYYPQQQQLTQQPIQEAVSPGVHRGSHDERSIDGNYPQHLSNMPPQQQHYSQQQQTPQTPSQPSPYSNNPQTPSSVYPPLNHLQSQPQQDQQQSYLYQQPLQHHQPQHQQQPQQWTPQRQPSVGYPTPQMPAASPFPVAPQHDPQGYGHGHAQYSGIETQSAPPIKEEALIEL
jgi:growth factor-regulated tyrosine kinase substrate